MNTVSVFPRYWYYKFCKIEIKISSKLIIFNMCCGSMNQAMWILFETLEFEVDSYHVVKYSELIWNDMIPIGDWRSCWVDCIIVCTDWFVSDCTNCRTNCCIYCRTCRQLIDIDRSHWIVLNIALLLW